MNMLRTSAIAAAALSTTLAAQALTLDFEQVSSFASINSFYDGGTDSAGVAGPAWGVDFGGDALGLKNDFQTYFSHAPSPVGVMTAVGPDANLNLAQGFSGMLSFHYAASDAVTGGVQVWSGLGATGTLLASFDLAANAQADGCSDSAFCHFGTGGGAFNGLAHSVSFGNAAYVAAFDNVSLSPVPELASIWQLTLGLLGLVAVSMVARRH